MMSERNYCVFVLTHGRANNVITLKTLKKCGYDGKWMLVCDDEDEQLDQYISKYGEDRVAIFSKDKIEKRFDTMDLSKDRRTIVYARNACYDIAAQHGYDYFVELDDDYTAFEHRYVSGGKLLVKKMSRIHDVFESMFCFLDKSGAKTVALAQGGDFIGGAQGGFFKKGLSRKAMNVFFCKTSNRMWWFGRINEDVNAYTLYGQRRELLFTFTRAAITQKSTQSNKGGMTDTYLDGGTYVKSFYSVICSPSCVKVAVTGDKHKRIHHRVQWEYCTPKILNERYRR